MSTLRDIYIYIYIYIYNNYKGKNINKPKYYGEIITTGESRKNIQ